MKVLKCHFIGLFIFIIIKCVRNSQTLFAGDGIIREYCQGEDFMASCNKGEVITMTTAMYGSMKIGRCLEDDYGHLGCAADVMDIADRECSGRKECTIKVPNKDMDSNRKCLRDLARYLEISYRCQKG